MMPWFHVMLLSFVGLSWATDHPCNRPCDDISLPMTCRYDFTVEWYRTMTKECENCPFNKTSCYADSCISANGVPRPVISVNRQIPGPAIEVCENDTIVVRVKNMLDSEGTTLHWHGLHQVDTPWMDGVPMVTQCPIPAMTEFQYKFKAWPAGTHFWHGHSGHQKSDGMFGPLIIRQNIRNEPNSETYGEDLSDHVIMINDWVHDCTTSKYTKHIHDNGNQRPDSILINGRGVYMPFIDHTIHAEVNTPRSVFYVSRNQRYRFRVIEAGFLTCPVVISITNHQFTIISTDGYPMQSTSGPQTSMILHPGESVDIVVETNAAVGNYWMYFKGIHECEAAQVFEKAILRYEGATDEDPTSSLTYEQQENGEQTTDFSIYKSLLENDSTSQQDADVTYYLALDMDVMGMSHAKMDMGTDMQMNNDDPGMHHGTEADSTINTSHMPMTTGDMQMSSQTMDMTTPSMNMASGASCEHDGHTMDGMKDGHHIDMSNMHQEMAGHVHHPHINMIQHVSPSSPLLTQFNDVNQSMLCNSTSKPEGCPKDVNSKDTCHCTHLMSIPLGAVVELIMVDQGVMADFEHSMHMHGGSFRVIASQRINKTIKFHDVKKLNEQGGILRNLDHAVTKDVVYVPDGGYTVIRFHAYNPGFWIFHCHLSFHLQSGMALVFQVGELSDMKPAPRNFPTCGNFLPIDEDYEVCQTTENNYKLSSGNIKLSSKLINLTCLILFCSFIIEI